MSIKAFRFWTIFLCTSIFFPFLQAEEKKLVIIVPSFNNASWAHKNMMSLLNQKYANYEIIFVDDASGDATTKIVEGIKCNHRYGDRITIKKNDQRLGKVANIWHVLHNIDGTTPIADDSIVIIMDGDDWYPHNDVFNYINNIYSNEDVWCTYGGYITYPDKKKCCNIKMSEGVIQNHSFRSVGQNTSQQRTFYAGLYRYISIESLVYKGKFMQVTGDVAKMLPMLEMSSPHFKLIEDSIYVYNRSNRLNDDKVSYRLQKDVNTWIRNMAPYNRLTLEEVFLSPAHRPIDAFDVFIYCPVNIADCTQMDAKNKIKAIFSCDLPIGNVYIYDDAVIHKYENEIKVSESPVSEFIINDSISDQVVSMHVDWKKSLSEFSFEEILTLLRKTRACRFCLHQNVLNDNNQILCIKENCAIVYCNRTCTRKLLNSRGSSFCEVGSKLILDAKFKLQSVSKDPMMAKGFLYQSEVNA